MATDPRVDFVIAQAASTKEIAAARELFLEYARAMGFSLCFQGFDKELAGLPGEYAPPQGRLLLGWSAGEPVGCVAMHALPGECCEMKRLFVRPAFRGTGLGRRLAERVIAEARAIGYTHMRLETIATTMAAAVALYKRLGFAEIAPYREKPISTALYMELKL